MRVKRERGFSFVEFMMVATMLSFVSTGVKTFVIDKARGPQRRIARRDLATQGRASVERMVKDLELAGRDTASSATDRNTPAPGDSNPVAPAFLVAAADQVVFDADLDGDGVVERVEYRLHNSVMYRSAVSKNSDGSFPPAQYEVVTEYVDNGSLPLFRYASDASSESSVTAGAPGDVQKVWITLLLRPPVLDPKRPQFRTLRFDGLAQQESVETGSAMAGLQKP
jgi:Tfp pilus assembly protein PilW